MALYKKRPIVVEAFQWFPDKPVEGVIYPVPDDRADISFRELFKECGLIKTLEGDHVVSPGDWIITGVNGEKYPCENDIFVMTYDPVVE